ncbi:MAG: hypothetical protein FJW30_25625 [Acidobacteria bacterium]|nr:hypothetical protein [Acidobacteriota bacterium]
MDDAKRRVAGKVLTYLGLFLTGAGMLGGLQPHLDIARSEKVMAQVTGNDIAYRQPGLFGFRLQLKWTAVEGEQRTNITTPVRAADETAARRTYRGRHLEVGQTYEFSTSPGDPNRLQPFLAYNWDTFGRFLLITLAGFLAFAAGMSLARRAPAVSE